MALSNWDTMAFEFSLTRRPRSEEIDGPETPEIREAAAAVAAAREEFQAEFTRRGLDIGSPEWMELYERSEMNAASERLGRLRQIVEVDISPAGGSHSFDSGYSVDIYKNWVYLRSPERHLGDGREGFVDGTLAQINEGSMRIGGIDLEIRRGPQDGCYVFAAQIIYPEDRKDPAAVTRQVGMFGCGVYGFDDEGEFCGVLPDSVEFLQQMITEFQPLLAEHSLTDHAVRYNQGDAFFAANLGFDIPASAPGQAEETVMGQMLARGADASAPGQAEEASEQITAESSDS